jgi:nucleotide-binding universal stress UspA family protein
MTPFDTLLFPVDFSERSAGAAPAVANFARRFRAELTLLHVLEAPFRHFSGPEVGMSFGPDEVALQRSRTEMELARFAADRLPGIAAKIEIAEGDPAHEIVRFAHDRKVGLVMMPTHGYGRFRRFILGSVTAKVLHDADCPVWTGVHLEQAAGDPGEDCLCCNSVVCCLDLGPRSQTILEWASRIAGAFGTPKMTLAHAIPATEARPDRYFDQEFQVAARNAAREEIARLQRVAGTQCDVRVEAGDASKVVTQVANDVRADLVIIGRGTNETILGRMRTHAYAIIRESPCPVISV